MDNRQTVKNNRHNRLQRVLCSLLAFATVLGGAMYAVPSASAADYAIDTTKFKSATKNAETVYYWHEGLPPATAVDGTAYPVLITWADKYYLCADANFGKVISNRANTRIQNYVKKKEYGDGILRFADSLGTASIFVGSLGLSDKLVGGDVFKESALKVVLDSQDGKTWYNTDCMLTLKRDSYDIACIVPYARLNARYNMSSSALLSNNPVYKEYQAIKAQNGSFVDDLLQNGFAVTEAIPNLPYLVCAEPAPGSVDKGNRTAYMDLMSTNQSRWGIMVPKTDDNYFTHQYNWIIPTQHYDVEVVDWRGYQTAQGSQWRDDILYDFCLDYVGGTEVVGVQPDYAPVNFVKKETKISPRWFSGSLYHCDNIPLRKRTWIFEKQSDGSYEIGGWCGLNSYIDPEFTNKGGYPAGTDGITSILGYPGISLYEEVGGEQHMGLYYDGSNLVTRALDTYKTINLSASQGNTFRIFWGEPITLNYYRDSFNVVSGQVVNIDGPACIDEGVVYRVKDGGVLVMTDWVVNNGAIIVENGGTLIVEENTDAYGHTRSCLVMSQVNGGDGGRIASEGTIIIMPGCKLFGGGKYGIQLGEGAYVANYGTIGSENFTCYRDNTIENRGTESSVFAGYSVLGCGISLTNYKITDRTFPNQGNRESNYKVQIARNAVYGPGSHRFYTNPSIPNADISVAPRSGSVVNAVKYKELEWVFTADQLYDITFPYYYDGGMLKSLWVYRGAKVRMYSNGVCDIEVPSNISGYNEIMIETVSGDDYVVIYKGNPGPQWQYPTSGTEVYVGDLGKWSPPSRSTEYYNTN